MIRGGSEGDSWWAREMLSFPDPRRALPYEAQAWRFGDTLTLVGLESEVCSELGPLARGLAKTPHAAAVAYANACEGYIPTRRIVREGGYEGDTSHRAYLLPARFTPRVEDQFRRIVSRAVAGLR
jgi:hypothetical protein